VAKLSAVQESIFRFIREFCGSKGYPPSIREIGKAFGISSTNGVRYHLNILAKNGLLKREKKTFRGIQIPRGNYRSIPIVGQVRAGQPILAIENISGEIGVDPALFGFNEFDTVFCLKVEGDSMIKAGIYEGDVAVVHKQETAENGDIVVALLEDSATLKRFYRKKQGLVLCPENDNYEPIEISINSEKFNILGKVIGIIRPKCK